MKFSEVTIIKAIVAFILVIVVTCIFYFINSRYTDCRIENHDTLKQMENNLTQCYQNLSFIEALSELKNNLYKKGKKILEVNYGEILVLNFNY